MTTTSPLTSPLIKSESSIDSRGIEFVVNQFERYGVKSYAIYIDHTTKPKDLPCLPDLTCIGYYTFDINRVGTNINEHFVELISLDGLLPDCDGWLVASTSRASGFSLAKALLESGKNNQIIVRYYGGQTTEITAYIDFLSGESNTYIYLQHYYDRKYRITFPIDIRWAICSCEGSVIKSGQWVINPGACVFMDSKDFDLGDFQGYLFVELEVENLQVRVQPFIHFWADYISSAGICRNHQSGWAQWPQNTIFNRGIIPTSLDFEAFTCIYNANDTDVSVNAILHFCSKGLDQVVERKLLPISAGHMSYQNLTELFDDVPFREAKAAYVLLTCDHPLHRPNHYIVKKGTFQTVDTYHQTGGNALHCSHVPTFLNQKQCEKREEFSLKSFEIIYPLIDKRYGIETILGLLSLSLCHLSKVVFYYYNVDGVKIFSKKEKLSVESEPFININHYLMDHGIEVDRGTFGVSIQKKERVPSLTGLLMAFKHKECPHYHSTSFVAGHPDINIPFYAGAKYPKSREYQYSPLQISDHFGPGTINAMYDSFYVVRHRSLYEKYSKKAEYRLEIFEQNGRMHTLYRTIPPNSHDVFFLSEVLKDVGLCGHEGHYTLWFKSYNQLLKPYIALFRKSDKAIALDDASEGTLQNEPQIGQIDPMELDEYIRRIGLVR